MEGLFAFLEWKMTTPTDYGWFHLTFIALMITVTTLLCVFFRDCSDKTVRRIALIAWIILLVGEAYKQFVFTYSYENGAVTADFQWYAFPFQFCSTPLYALPFLAFLKKGRLRDMITVYLATFALFGGLLVYIYPNDVFVDLAGIDLQTMIHHGLQIVIGVFLLVHERKQLNALAFWKGIPVFATFILVAIALNEGVYAYFLRGGVDDTFNMFFISRHFECTLPVLSDIYKATPYPVFLLLYTVGFSVCATVVYFVAFGVRTLVEKFANKKQLP